MRKYGKRDRNHADVVGWYRELGCSVLDLGDLGDGAPDLFVGVDGVSDPVEIKFEKGTLTTYQKSFHYSWKGSPVVIVRTHFDVVTHVGQMRIRAK
jgi:hypothetical protein